MSSITCTGGLEEVVSACAAVSTETDLARWQGRYRLRGIKILRQKKSKVVLFLSKAAIHCGTIHCGV